MEPTDHNLRAWDEVHRRRAEAMAGELGIPVWVRERLPDVAGKHVLHLQCGTGESTAELAELGALVTGLDSSGEALEVARERAPNAVFIQADVHTLPTELRRRRFDLVYTGGGVLTWVLDLEPWAHGVATALKPGGQLLLYDSHPVVTCLDAALHWRESYFRTEVETNVGRERFQVPGPDATDEMRERFWQLGQTVTAVADAGLVVTQLDELPSDPRWRRQDPRVPGEFVLLARKPAAPAG
jgi:SAM-dependent methyltransferase